VQQIDLQPQDAIILQRAYESYLPLVARTAP
jgi:hypothetical protein